MDFSNVTFKCSRLGEIMSASQGPLSEKEFTELSRLQMKDELTQLQEWRMSDLLYRRDNFDHKSLGGRCKTYLRNLYGYIKYGKRYIMKGDAPLHLIKGTLSEIAATQMVERVTGSKFYRYKTRLKNKYLNGILDIIDAPEIEKCKIISDIKNSSSLSNFLTSADSTLPKSIYLQMQGYFALTGKEMGIVYNCLVDLPDHMIKEQHDILFQQLCPDGVITSLFEEEWAKKDGSFRYGNIPEEERVIPFPVERDEKIIEKIYEKVELCREWLSEFEKRHKNRTYGIVLDQ